MAFELPPAPPRYSRQNENQTRRLIEQAFSGLFARLTILEADVATGETPSAGPTASFSVSVTGRVVNFTDLSTAGDAPIVSWSWDFGDSTSSTSQNPTHTYDSVGTFTVVLTVTDENTAEDTFSVQVTTEQIEGVILPVGMMAFGGGGLEGDVGEGPNLDTGAPYFTACHFVPNTSTIGAIIDTARAKGITLVLNVAGNKSSWKTTDGTGKVVLDMQQYKDNVSRFGPNTTAFADRAKFAQAVRDRVIVLYVVDEPNLTNSQNPNLPDITCADTNEMALWHKTVWAGYNPITLVRVPADTMRDGWLGTNPGNSFWTGVDYCWSQYTLRHGRGGPQGDPWSTPIDPLDLYVEQKAIAETLDMGVIPSLNMWAGGHGIDGSGVTAKWDTGNNGGALGYLLGDREADRATVVTTLNDNIKSLASSPNWIRKHAERIATDPDAPFLLYWQHNFPESASDEYLSYYNRSDYDAAFDDAIRFGLARAQFNGWRTAK